MAGLHAHIENYKAINSADIELSDLTVLAGVNASGKSTLARLFHRLVCIESHFEHYATDFALKAYANTVLLPLKNAVRGASPSLYYRLRRIETMMLGHGEKSFEKKVKVLRKEIEDLFAQPSFSGLLSDSRLLEALDRSSEHREGGAEYVSKIGVKDWLESELKKGERFYTQLTSRGEGSAALFLVQRFQGDFFNPMAMLNYQKPEFVIKISDGAVPIFDSSNIDMPFKPIFTPRQSFYIARPSVDMPMVRGATVELNGIEYDKVDLPENMPDLHIQDFVGGSIDLPKDVDGVVSGEQWRFSLTGDQTIPIAQCADGIKSISAIMMLDKCGLLASDSLLIIDEPEVHLHPRWIVEMAHVLVRLAKFRKVRVLITTHSPDMVHALRDFSANEDLGSRTCFYLAKEDKVRKGKYNYDKLSMNIGPIFTVFNQAKDRIASIAKDIREGTLA